MGEIQKEEQKTQMFRYKDALLPTQERVNDLLSHMTLREKVGQLNQRLYGFRAYERKGDEITLTKETIEEAKYFGGLGGQQLRITDRHQSVMKKSRKATER